MPRQLDRIRMYNEYCNHPLRKEYEKKVEKIKNANGKNFVYYIIFILIFIVWIPFFAVLLGAVAAIIGIEKYYFTDWALTIFFGLILLIIACALSSTLSDVKYNVQQKNNKNELEQLKEQYSKKGLYVFTYNDLVDTVCLDENDDSEPICGVTGAYIGYGQKYYFCNKSGNCRKCKTFMTALYGNDWDGEYEME